MIKYIIIVPVFAFLVVSGFGSTLVSIISVIENSVRWLTENFTQSAVFSLITELSFTQTFVV